MNVLFCASELYPLIKTGGLADVAHALPEELLAQGLDCRIFIPAYRTVLEKCYDMQITNWMQIQGAGRRLEVRVLRAKADGTNCPLYLLDCPELFDRPGNPYLTPDGSEWSDNGERFTVYSAAAYEFALNGEGKWRPDIVHANDWQTGLIPAFLSQNQLGPASVFTIHNLSYGGNFSHDDFINLKLPWHWWSINGAEFHGGLSMLKAGIAYADRITTVSPTYAKEVLTPAFGYGLDGILSAMQHKFSGILNGIDEEIWNPATDTFIDKNYTKATVISGKSANKKALLKSFGMATNKDMLAQPLAGFVGRMVEQKGLGLLLAVLPELFANTALNVIFIGTGDERFEHAVASLADTYPERCQALIGYSEERAHQLEAGVDFFLMPSAFEPCGLNQLYSLKYGTPPLVHHTGGLADSVKRTNGFVFNEFTPTALHESIMQALAVFANKPAWKKLVQNAMTQDFSWTRSAHNYIKLYNEIT